MAKTVHKNKATNIENFEKLKLYNITIAPTDRSYKGIDRWRSALISAENVTNPQRKQLYDLFDELILDPHLSAAMEKRILNVLNTEIKYYNAKGEEDETVYNVIKQPFFRQMCRYILQKASFGHSLIYFENINAEGGSVCKLIPRKNVKPEKGIVVKNYYDETGVSYEEAPTSSYVISAGEKRDLGLLNKVAPYVIYKKGDMADWALFAEIFGTPFRWAEYDGFDPNVKKQIEEALKMSVGAKYGLFPEGTSFHMEESQNKSGSTDLYKSLANFCNKEVSKAFLGNTMTLDAEGGNYKGEVHEAAELRIAEADKKDLISILNTDFIRVLETFGIKAEGGYFDFEQQDEEVTLADRLTMDMQLNNLIDIPDDYFYEKYGIPKPEKKDKVAKKAATEVKEEIEVKKDEKSLTDSKRTFGLSLNPLKWLKSFFVLAPRKG